MDDSPAALAADLIADIGRDDALLFLWSELRECATWRERWAGVRLIAAVLAA